ncbi:glycosyltransferase family 4 protein [Aerococcus viridans]
MNILHVNSNYTFTKLHAELIEKLERPEINNTIFMPHSGTSKAVIDANKHKNLYSKKTFNNIERYFFYLKQKKIFKMLRETINLNNINLVHAHTLFTDGYVALKIFKKYNIPYVVTVRNTDINLFFKKRLLLRSTGIEILNNASAITFLSESYFNQTFNNYLSEKDKKRNINKSYIIPNGINKEWHNNNNLKKKKNEEIIKIVYVGRINKNKNILATIKASEILIEKGYKVEFRVIGANENDTIMNEINKRDFISYEQNKTLQELIEVYREEDIFVMPSFYESFGLVYAEAMSQGLPIIYTENQGFDNQFEDGLVGFRVNPVNSEMISEKILALWRNYDYFSENSLNNANKFDWEKIANKYSSIYLEIYNNRLEAFKLCDENEEGNL